LLIFGCYSGRVLLSAIGNLFTIEASQKIVLSLRTRLLKHIDKLSPSYHEGVPLGARFYLFREPMDEIGQLCADLLPALLRTTVLTISVITAMAVINLRLTLCVVPTIPAFLFVTSTYRRLLRGSADRFQQEQSKQSEVLQEHLGGITQLQLLTAERFQERRMFGQFAAVVRALCKLWRSSAQFTIASNAVILAGIVVVLGLGGWEFLQRRLTIGGFVAFYTYLTRLFEPLSGGVELYSRLQRVGASISKVRGAFQELPQIRDMVPQIVLSRERRGEMRFDGVNFSYNGNGNVLSDLTFTIHAGERVAFVGPNGSGKSTTGKLMARLYDPNSGIVSLDGSNIRMIGLVVLRQSVAYLPQQASLFLGTLQENLLFGNRTSSRRDLEWAIELAELGPIVSQLPGGLSAQLGPDGAQLSSGQRQRVALARTVLRRPLVMILDEATSLIEGDAERRILSRLNKAIPETSLVVISHHLPALSWADQIFVLHSGSVVERGSLPDLYRPNTLFGKLFQSHGGETSLATYNYEEHSGALPSPSV
jgi:ABC-type multidrug transport system fused ATPase/permease subunit